MKNLLAIFISFIPIISVAQEITLSGFLGVEGGESFSYKLVFKDSSGSITGNSFTWLHEKNDVKAKLEGTINRLQQTISIRETEILYNHGFWSYATICLVKATLKYKVENGSMSLSGPITSTDITNVQCSKGTVVLTGKEIENLFVAPSKDTLAVVPKQVKEIRKPTKVFYDTVSRQPATSIARKQEKITTGVEKIYEWNADTVVIHIWDGGKLDGDIISIRSNEEAVLTNYKLTQEKKRLKIPIAPGETKTITITAMNEGNEPPNTADILLVDGDKNYSVLAYNNIGKKAVVRIKKIDAKD